MNDKSNSKQALWLAISQFCTFALSFVSAAILSRYFDKNEYGTYRQILYVYNTMLILFTAGLPSVFSYFIPRLNVSEQKSLVNTMTKILVYIGGLFSIVLFFSSSLIAKLLENPELIVGIKLFSLFPLFTLPAMGVEGIYTAIRETKRIAVYVFFSKVLMLIFIVAPVLIFRTTYRGAIIGWGIANFIIFLFAIYMKNRPYSSVNAEIVPNIYKRIFDYTWPLTGAFIAGFIISCADQFFISRYYGTDTFADFSNGNLTIPFAAMIAGSIKAVLLPVLSKAQAEDKLLESVPVYVNAVIKSIRLVIPIISFAVVFGSYLMTFLYSPKYLSSTSYFQMHAIRDFIGAIPYFSVLLAFGLSKFYMRIHWFGIFFIWGLDSLLVYVIHAPAYYIVLNQSLLQFFIVIGAFIYVKKKVGVNFLNMRLIKEFSVILSSSLSIALISYTIINTFISSDISTESSFLALSLGGCIYLIILIICGKYFKINYLETIKLFSNRNGSKNLIP